MKVVRVIGWVVAALAVLYSTLLTLAPGVLKTAEVESRGVIIALTITVVILVLLLNFLNFAWQKFKKEEKKKGKYMTDATLFSTIITTIIITAFALIPFACLSFLPTTAYYYNGERWEKAGVFELNYPGKGGKYDNGFPDPYTIKLKDGTSVDLHPIPEKETEIFNLIGEDGSKRLPAFIEKQTNDDNFEKFRASFNQAGLGKYFHGQATITIEF